jgi:hypothetical protein
MSVAPMRGMQSAAPAGEVDHLGRAQGGVGAHPVASMVEDIGARQRRHLP